MVRGGRVASIALKCDKDIVLSEGAFCFAAVFGTSTALAFVGNLKIEFLEMYFVQDLLICEVKNIL